MLRRRKDEFIKRLLGCLDHIQESRAPVSLEWMLGGIDLGETQRRNWRRKSAAEEPEKLRISS